MSAHESRLEPKLITVLREGYSRKQFFHDLMAGIIVGIVALPLSIALAIASGVKPEQGLITAVIAGFLISALSGSRVQIGGPTGAFIVLVYDIVQQHGYEGLALATLMAGALLVLMGVTGLGSVIKFIPYPVTVGFTSGIAVIIFTTQIKDFFGLDMGALPGEFYEKIVSYAEHITTTNVHALALGLVSLLVIYFWPRVTRRVPGSLIAILLGTLAVHLLKLPVETIGTRFGEVPHAMPMPHLPDLHWGALRELVSPAFAIALLAGIESLLSAVVADGMTGRRHRSNMELVAQGVANLASPLFGGIPATGAIARTATNIRNGGTTPFAGIIHALTLLLIMMLFGKWAVLIPMPVLAAILMKVAYDMSEWHMFVKLISSPRSDVLVLLSTFALTVLVDLTVAIEVGVVMAAFLFMRRMADVTQVGFVTDELQEPDPDDPDSIAKKEIPKGVEVFEIYGPFFFGAADRFKDAMRSVEKAPKALILQMRHVPAMDATGLRALEDVCEKSKKEKTAIILCGVLDQPRDVLQKSGLIVKMADTLDDALIEAQDLIQARATFPGVPDVGQKK